MHIYGEKMVYCSNCGDKIPDDAYFCPKCGTKTPVGKASKATYPADELRDTFHQVGVELERAFTIAAKKTQNAFKKVSEDIQKKNPSNNQGNIECTSCKSKNVSGAVFCHSCGARVVYAGEPAGSN
jgi:uncharacterized membrane protein YvbJ